MAKYINSDHVTPNSKMSESENDLVESPSSSLSTSRLLKESDHAQRKFIEQGSLRSSPFKSHSRSVSSLEKRHTRVVIRRVPSPTTKANSINRGTSLSYSTSDVYNGTHGLQIEYHNSDVFLPSTLSHINEMRHSSNETRGESFRIDGSRHVRTLSAGGRISQISRAPSIRSNASAVPMKQSSLAEEALNAPRITSTGMLSRQSSRRSVGQEWTRHHWHKMKDLEEDSERARRCSKLSSGFAPLMVFGGLVFICIGISAFTNTGKDKERLKQLSTAPLVMGVFMLVLGAFLICTWFSCRSKAKLLDQKLLHGSRRNSTSSEENLVQSIIAKLYSQLGNNVSTSSNRPATPAIHGVTLDGTVIHKSPQAHVSQSPCTPNSDRCRQCGTNVIIGRETSV